MAKSITITSAIPEEYYDIAKAQGWKWQEVFIAGVKARQGNVEILKRINELESDNDALRAKLQRVAVRLLELENPDIKTKG